MRLISALFALATLSGCMPMSLPEVAERGDVSAATLPPMNTFVAQAAPLRRYNNSDVANDFLDLAFALESGREIERLSRFEEPVTVALRGSPPASLQSDLDQLLARIRREAGIEIVRSASDAAITIEVMPLSRMQRIVPSAACFVVPGVSSWSEFRRNRNSRRLDWNGLSERERVAIFIPSDVAPQEIRDCLHEEIAQALGPLNDLYRLTNSVFNDDNLSGVLTSFDMLILRIFYDDALSSGLTREEVANRLPEILARLNPSGGPVNLRRTDATPRSWIDAIETALGPGVSEAQRMVAARSALSLARVNGWQDGRTAYSYFALGRVTLTSDPGAALRAMQEAGELYAQIAPGGVQTAHVDLHLAAFALAANRTSEALSIARRAQTIAREAENASLLSALLMIEAEALAELNRESEARRAQLESVAWARYGFGTSSVVASRSAQTAQVSRRPR